MRGGGRDGGAGDCVHFIVDGAQEVMMGGGRGVRVGKEMGRLSRTEARCGGGLGRSRDSRRMVVGKDGGSGGERVMKVRAWAA